MGCNSGKASASAPASIIEQTKEEKALAQLKLVFDGIDSDADKAVSNQELFAAMKNDTSLVGLMKDAGLTANSDVLGQLDGNKDGVVTWDEFVAVLKGAAVIEVKDTGVLAAAELPADEKALSQLRLIFNGIDSDADGSVCKKELADALEKDDSLSQLIRDAGFNPEFNFFEQLDTNSVGRVSWEEFKGHLQKAAVDEVQATGDVAGVELPAQEKALVQLQLVFDSLDKNGDNRVSKEELSAALEKDASLCTLVKNAGLNPDFYTLEQLDENQDGFVSWDEFKDSLQQSAVEEVKLTGDVQTAAALQDVKIEGEEESKSLCC